jgi:D-serine deaminase-like pyridoxal phosphate-dependent protein
MNTSTFNIENNYNLYSSALNNFSTPLAYVDLNLLDKNIEIIIQRNTLSKNIRLATKSIRSIDILKYIFSKSEIFKGLMAYDAREAAMLSVKGFDDILIAYPEVDERKIQDCIIEIQKGKQIIFMIDQIAHLQILQKIAKKNNCRIPICIDIDLSSTFPFIYFGVYRSSIKTINDVENIIQKIQEYENLKLVGIMGYEAQIAGLGDNFVNEKIKSAIIKFLKKISLKSISKKRNEIQNLLQKKNINIQWHNGGGTGSIETTTKDAGITEVTVGSGFFQSHLFDNYTNFKHYPSAGFVLQITRKPTPNIITCNGGGYIASGATNANKLPKPYMPYGLSLIKDEGAGEVQTPLLLKQNMNLNIGDLVFFRHAKAGELCEHFNELYLLRNGKVENIVKTYRGEGFKFL